MLAAARACENHVYLVSSTYTDAASHWMISGIYDREGRVLCFQPGTTQRSKRYPDAPLGFLYGGENHDAGCPVGGSDPSWWNIAPRIGLAYRLTADGKTSLRLGSGFYYTPIHSALPEWPMKHQPCRA
jgi:hypothetical protein